MTQDDLDLIARFCEGITHHYDEDRARIRRLLDEHASLERDLAEARGDARAKHGVSELAIRERDAAKRERDEVCARLSSAYGTCEMLERESKTLQGQRDAALRDLAELREAAAKLEADLRAETGRANHWQSENHEWCAWAGKFLHERGCERRKRLGGGPMPKMLRASVAGYTRQIERALAETRESVRGAVKAGHVARNGRGWAKVLEAIDALAALLPAEPPKEASDMGSETGDRSEACIQERHERLAGFWQNASGYWCPRCHLEGKPDEQRAGGVTGEYEPLSADELARVNHQVGGVDHRNTREGHRDTMVCARIVVLEHATLRAQLAAAERERDDYKLGFESATTRAIESHNAHATATARAETAERERDALRKRVDQFLYGR